MNTLRTRRRYEVIDRYGYPTGRWYWSEWEDLAYIKPGQAADALAYWRDLNAYAVSQRGPQNTAREFMVVEGVPYDPD